MATNQPTSVPVNHLHQYDHATMEIENRFNHLIEQLIARKDALLTKLQTMREDFITKETTRKAAIEELERMIQQMKEESIKVNMNYKVQKRAIQVYREELEQHQIPSKLPQPFFTCPTLYHLQTHISEFGEVRELELDHSLEKQPVLVVAEERNAFESFTEVKSTMNNDSEYFSIVVSSSNKREIFKCKRKITIREALDPILKNWGYGDVSKVCPQLRYYAFELEPQTTAGVTAGKEVFIKAEDSVDEILRGFHSFINRAELTALTQDYININGWYLIRESSSGDGQLSLAVTFAKELKNFKIIFNPSDATYRVSRKIFDTVHQLVDYYKYNFIKRIPDGDIFLLHPITKTLPLPRHELQPQQHPQP